MMPLAKAALTTALTLVVAVCGVVADKVAALGLALGFKIPLHPFQPFRCYLIETQVFVWMVFF